MKIEQNNKYIKIIEPPKIEIPKKVKTNLDDQTKKLVTNIINNNNLENNKVMLNNLKDFKIKRNSIFMKIIINPLFKLAGKELYGCYNFQTNTMYIYKNEEKVIGHELIHMASSIVKDGTIFVGFSQQFNLKTKNPNVGIGLTEGYTSLEAERIFGYESSIEKMKDRNVYDINKDISMKLEKIVGKNKMRKLFYSASLYGLIKELKNYTNLDEIVEFVTNIDLIHNLNITNHKNSNSEKIRDLTKKTYLTLYKWNSIKRKDDFEKGLISKAEYEELTIDFSRYYTLDIMRLFNYDMDKIIEEDVRKI